MAACAAVNGRGFKGGTRRRRQRIETIVFHSKSRPNLGENTVAIVAKSLQVFIRLQLAVTQVGNSWQVIGIYRQLPVSVGR
jgi:hypothetical protein